MSRAQRRHGNATKKSYTGWIVFGVVVLLVAGYVVWDNTKGTGVDYSQYSYTDDVYAAPSAKITLDEYGDFQCPACRAYEPVFGAIREAYKGDVQFVFHEYPLRTIHEHAQESAEAAECARAQNRFWAYHDVLYASGKLASRELKLHAQGLGLDMNSWSACMEQGSTKADISTSILEGNQRGVQGTPTIYINGEEFPGRTVAEFEAKIQSLQ